MMKSILELSKFIYLLLFCFNSKVILHHTHTLILDRLSGRFKIKSCRKLFSYMAVALEVIKNGGVVTLQSL